MLFNNKNAFTLIELLVVISLLGLIITIMYSFLFNSLRYIQMSNDQHLLQRDLRLISNFITEELRNAVEISLFTSVKEVNIPTPFPTDDETNFIILDKDSIKHISKNGIFNKSIVKITRLNFALILKDNDTNVLKINIVAEKGQRKFSISTQILLNNIYDQKENLNENTVLCYKKP